MTNERPPAAGEPLPAQPDPAEQKRLAARRRFLSRGAAGGTGLLIVTLNHQRAFADQGPRTDPYDKGTKGPPPGQQGDYKPQGVLVSNALVCSSINGNAVATVTVYDEDLKDKVERVDCVRR